MASRATCPKTCSAAAGAWARVVWQTVSACGRRRRAGAARPATPAGPRRCPSTPAAPCRRTTSCSPWRTRWRPASASAWTSADAGCCGHPSRGTVGRPHGPATRRSPSARPATPASTHGRRRGRAAVGRAHGAARRDARRLMAAAAPAFVPYVGCLGRSRRARWPRWPRGRDQAGAGIELSPIPRCTPPAAAPSAACTAAPPGQRDAAGASRPARAPVVTTCVLCRDNLRSAARELALAVPIHFWPEFFRAVPEAERR